MYFLSVITDTLLLFAIGLTGWMAFKYLRLPTPALLGTLAAIAILKAFQVEVPSAPSYIAPVVQIFLGLYIGAKVTRDKVGQLKQMVTPAIIIVVWVLVVAFFFGMIFSKVTHIDLYTAILSSSLGGLPEMTILALGTSARAEVVIVMLVFRMLATVIFFPFIMKIIAKGAPVTKKKIEKEEEFGSIKNVGQVKTASRSSVSGSYRANQFLTILVAVLGGVVFYSVGIPAGTMVGAMLFIIVASLAGMKVTAPSIRFFPLMLIGVGIMVADSLPPGTAQLLLSEKILFIAGIYTVIIFILSAMMAWLVSYITKWDFATSYLAVAPAGLTVMTALAMEYGKDPLRIMALHLCRLVTLKSVIPLVFMWLG